MKVVVVLLTAGLLLGHSADRQRFVPEGARLVARWSVPAGGGLPKQLLAHWQRRGRPGQGIWLWQRSGDGWRRLATVPVEPYAYVRLRRSDVTDDGHLDVLVEEEQGSGGCGAKRLLVMGPGRVRTVFRSYLCDRLFRFESGRLVQSSGQYTLHDSHCCPTFTRRTEYVWTGRRMKAVRSKLYWNCIELRCRTWRAGPLHFQPRFSSYWDRLRGVATGGTKPWLFGRTLDGGKSWTIVDASPCMLGSPRLGRPGHATVRFIRCNTESGTFKLARTSDYGGTWAAR